MDWLSRLREVTKFENLQDTELPKPSKAHSEDNDHTHELTIATDWRPEPKAWLTESGELRTRGVFDDLAGEIIKLTSDNLPLQSRLLRLHVGIYSGPYWLLMVRRWRERARVLFEAEGLGLHEANWIAAEEMNLLAFADELHLKKPTGDRGSKYGE